ncbi:MAG: hypothetical protein MJE68_26360 [Proteobacteria bacterium]|nr:hypothetical protein [Pseudomonadota bacterium]
MKSFVFFKFSAAPAAAFFSPPDLRAGMDGVMGQSSFGGWGEQALLSGTGGFTPGEVAITIPPFLDLSPPPPPPSSFSIHSALRFVTLYRWNRRMASYPSISRS